MRSQICGHAEGAGRRADVYTHQEVEGPGSMREVSEDTSSSCPPEFERDAPGGVTRRGFYGRRHAAWIRLGLCEGRSRVSL